MVIPEKLNWPSIGPPPANIHEHILLALNANQAMVDMIENNSRKDKRPSTDTLLLHLRGLNDVLSRTKDDPRERQILDAIYNLSDSTKRNFSSLNKKLIISSSNAQRSQPHIVSSQTANMSY